MAHSVKPRDSQRAKFNKWRYEVLLNAYPLTPVSDVRYFIEQELSCRSIRHPKFEHSLKGTLRFIRFLPAENKIIYNSFQRSLSEVAEIVAWIVVHNDSVPHAWHGAYFCKVFAEIYALYIGVPIQEIVDSMRISIYEFVELGQKLQLELRRLMRNQKIE